MGHGLRIMHIAYTTDNMTNLTEPQNFENSMPREREEASISTRDSQYLMLHTEIDDERGWLETSTVTKTKIEKTTKHNDTPSNTNTGGTWRGSSYNAVQDSHSFEINTTSSSNKYTPLL